MLEHLHNNQQMQEISWSTIYLLSNIYAGSGEMHECENCADDIQARQIDKLQCMMSQMSCTR